MVHNFESWRNATQNAHKPSGLAHFHLCSDSAFFDVSKLLRSLCVSYVEKQQIQLSQDIINSCLCFLDEMQFAYIHPRSTSAKFACRMDFSATR